MYICCQNEQCQPQTAAYSRKRLWVVYKSPALLRRFTFLTAFADKAGLGIISLSDMSANIFLYRKESEAMQNYNNSAENSNFQATNGYLLAKFNEPVLKSMSDIGIKASDVKYVSMFEAYLNMSQMRMKVGAIYRTLAEEYGISVSTVKRIIGRFKKITIV